MDDWSAGVAPVCGGMPRRALSAEGEDAHAKALVERFQGGEQWAFEELYKRYVGRVSACAARCAGALDAEDIVQEVFEKALVNLASYRRRDEPFEAWLLTIARNAAADHCRGAGRVVPSEPGELFRLREELQDVESAQALAWLSDEDLLGMVRGLSRRSRQVVLLRYGADLAWAEIARLVGCGEGSVRQTHSRALACLRGRLTALGRVPVRREAQYAIRRLSIPIGRPRPLAYSF